ncbi:CrpP-related protein [Caldimonas brevitalea]|uniref:Uncharacterized protein n=1 Tax=Caldimonas brevitalea TaxID=413882 RepID=A0A0G3BR41_9BURK|nr:CrpP-related protein [Caldimonas brevitalea]AKJ31892.1 hypothetical protein AAW51_5201 [Caldimonas brevitalea]
MKAPFDESALEREGARAARGGHAWQSNPFLKRENMPAVTGESLREWSRKHDAWQRGFEGYGRRSDADAKEPLSAEPLGQLVEERLRRIPRLQAEMQGGVDGFRLTLPKPHSRDAEGRNWDIDGFECGSLQEGEWALEIRSAIDELRDRYDLA